MCVSALICATVCVKFNLQLEATKGQAKLKKFNQLCLFCVLVASTEKNTQVHLVALSLVIFSFSTIVSPNILHSFYSHFLGIVFLKPIVMVGYNVTFDKYKSISFISYRASLVEYISGSSCIKKSLIPANLYLEPLL